MPRSAISFIAAVISAVKALLKFERHRGRTSLPVRVHSNCAGSAPMASHQTMRSACSISDIAGVLPDCHRSWDSMAFYTVSLPSHE
jgi:hypothetical protein